MVIPDEYLSETSLRRLLQVAEKLLWQTHFPQGRYDDDIKALMEDILQETLARIYEMGEPATPIHNWPGFMYTVMQLVTFEERRKAYHPKNNGLARTHLQANLESGDASADASEEKIPDPSAPFTEAVEVAELLSIICEEGEKVFEYPGFANFVDLVWRQGYSRTAAWNKIKGDCLGFSKATFFRRFEMLRKAVEARQVS